MASEDLIKRLRAWSDLAEYANAGWDLPEKATDALRAVCAESASRLERFAADAKRLDWLERRHVEVRTPLRYGSRANFHACPDLEEVTSDLRASIDAAIAAEQQKEQP